jgi:hypothetical protein
MVARRENPERLFWERVETGRQRQEGRTKKVQVSREMSRVGEPNLPRSELAELINGRGHQGWSRCAGCEKVRRLLKRRSKVRRDLDPR